VKAVALIVCWLGCISTCTAQSEPLAEVEANPGRPTVSTPATLTAVGYLQLETGSLFAWNSSEFSSRYAVNEVAKLTLHRRVQALLPVEPIVRSRAAGQPELHEGELFLGVQSVLVQGERSIPTISASYLRRIHSGPAPEVDLGTFRQSLIFLFSGDVCGFHYDANAVFSEQNEGAVRRAQYGQTLSISHPWRGFTISGEIWHFTQPFLGGHAAGNLWAAAYPLRKNLVLDAGFNRGLTATSTKWEFFAGFTYVIPHRLW
jgi:hypothetical protein